MANFQFQHNTLQLIEENNHRPFVLVNDKVVDEFALFDQSNPDIVVRLRADGLKSLHQNQTCNMNEITE